MQLRALIVEDAPAVAVLWLRELRRLTTEADMTLVRSEAQFIRAVEQGGWDLVLCGHNLLRYDCWSALRQLRERDPFTPFIVMSDLKQEAIALVALKAGAQDFLPKDDLSRLVPAVARALQEAGERRARSLAEDQERQKRKRLEFLLDMVNELASPGTFEDKVTRVMQELVDALEANSGGLWTPDEAAQSLVLRAEADSGRGILPVGMRIPPGQGVTGLAFTKGEVVTVGDYAAYADPLGPVRARGIRSVLAIPIKAFGKSVAVMSLGSFEYGYFTEERKTYAQGVADGLALLLLSAEASSRVKEQMDLRRRQIESFKGLARTLVLQTDYGAALQPVVDAARRELGAGLAALAVRAKDGGISQWVDSGLTQKDHARIGGSPAGHGLLREMFYAPVRVSNVQEHPGFAGFPTGHPVIRGCLAVPIQISGESRGVICLANKEDGRDFTEDDQSVLSLYAILAAVIIENVELFDVIDKERSMLASIQRSMDEGLAVFSAEGRLVYINPAAERLTDLDGSNAMGMTVQDLLEMVHDRLEPAAALDSLRSLVLGSDAESETFEVALSRPVRRQLLATRFAIHAGRDTPMRGLLLRDVSRERDLERRRDAFLSAAAHELRTPMTALLGFSELLLVRKPDADVQQQWLSIIGRETQRLADIVDDLLDASRIQSGRLSLQMEPIPLAPVVEQALQLVRPTAAAHAFVVDIPHSTPVVYADQNKLHQVLLNLLSNAVKYSPKGGRVEVRAVPGPLGHVTVSVTDQGFGIRDQDQSSLFQPFSRIRTIETSSIRGTGLGLYLVREMLRLMGGDVWVDSAEGMGSTFSFRIQAKV